MSDTLDPDDDGTGSTRVRSRESVGLGPVPAYQGEVTTVRSSSTSLLGQMLGEYRVLEPLGSGAQGDVFRGEHPVLHRQVAIKVLKPEYAVDANHKRRFLDEARAVIAARHPGIIDIFGVGETPDDRPWFVMELLEGEPLDLLLRGGPLSVTEAVKLLVPITQALGAAHAVGVIHRDLKPANIFVVQLPDGARFPKLLDFGLARRGEAGARVAQTSVGGTPLYLAPEQARGEAVGPQTDLYSLGCVAYEMLCGQPPFALTDLHALLDAHATLAPASLHSRGAVVPARLQQLITRLLAKQLSARPASAKEVREVLEQVQVDLARDGSPHATLQETELGEAPEVPSARRASAAASSRPRLGAVGETPSYSRRRSELGTTPETPSASRRRVELGSTPETPSASRRKGPARSSREGLTTVPNAVVPSEDDEPSVVRRARSAAKRSEETGVTPAEARATTQHPAVEAPPSRAWAFAAGVALLLVVVVGALGWTTREEPTPPPPTTALPREPEPVKPVPPPTVPEPVTPTPQTLPEVKPAPPTPEPEPLPRPKPAHAPKVVHHSEAEVRARGVALARRIARLPEDLRRTAEANLREARTCASPPDICWQELDTLESTYFKRSPP